MLASKVDSNSGIERALYLIEGPSPSIAIFNIADYSVNKLRLCCGDCRHSYSKVKKNPDKDAGGIWCRRCDGYTRGSWAGPQGAAVAESRRSGKSKPILDGNDKINRPIEISPWALNWLLWGHGGTYRRDKQESKAKYLAICYAVYYSLATGEDELVSSVKRAHGYNLVQLVDVLQQIIREVVASSRAGSETITAYAVAEKIGKGRTSFTGNRPLGRVYEYAKAKIADWENEIEIAFS